MKRSSRMLLGISIALITAATLHFTVGNRFHQRFREYGYSECGHHWKGHNHPHWKDGARQDPAPKDNSQEF